MGKMAFWLRWSLRDLRGRWMVVCALALVIAVGTGVAAAFGSMSEWRRISNDASYTAFNMHDVVVEFEDATVDTQLALESVYQIPHADSVADAQGRLDLSTQVEMVSGGETTIVPGRVVGVDLSGADGATIDTVISIEGESLAAIEESESAAVLEYSFAREHDLPDTGTVRITGGTAVEYIGVGQTPAYLLNGQAGWLGEEMSAALFMPLEEAQRLTGTEGQVNGIVIRLDEGADAEAVAEELESVLGELLPAAPTVTLRADDTTLRLLYDDIENDQKIWDFISFLVLGGAAVATFNLASRVVAAQRREIGAGAALGLGPRALAVRPLLFGLEISVLGVALGVGFGAALGWVITGILDNILPLPIWNTPVQPGIFAKAALVGGLLPLLGIGYPIVRAVRVQPAEAIRTAHIAVNGGRVGRALRRVRLPGSTVWHLPIRQALRAPGRTGMTAIGVAAVIAIMVGTLGILDSMGAALERGEDEQERGTTGRVVVTLATFYPVSDERITSVSDLPEVELAQAGLRLGATAIGESQSLDLVVDVLDFETAMWTPTVESAEGQPLDGAVPSGIVLAEKAARDLDLEPGDTVSIAHPYVDEQGGITTITSQVTVAAVHPGPIRSVAYLDSTSAGLFGLAGFGNQIQVLPADGVDGDELRGILLDNEAVTNVSSAGAIVSSMRDMMAQFTDLFAMLAGLSLILVLLIAFNTAAISVDERTRENATMRAFGLGVRRVAANAVIESMVIGVAGTLLGLAAGALVTWWVVDGSFESTMPDFDMAPVITVTTVVTALALGVLTVAVAPLLTVKRIWKTNIPSALRVVE